MHVFSYNLWIFETLGISFEEIEKGLTLYCMNFSDELKKYIRLLVLFKNEREINNDKYYSNSILIFLKH